MAIDLRDYQKYSGRSGDPYTRLGQALSKNAKATQERGAMPKGFSGGMRVNRIPGVFANLWFLFTNWRRTK